MTLTLTGVFGGCAAPNSIEQVCSIPHARDNHSGDEVMRKVAECANLSPREVYRIDLQKAVVDQDYQSWKIDEVRANLESWQKEATEEQQWQFLLNNPDSLGDLPAISASDLRQVVVTLWAQNSFHPEQYWFNIEDGQVSWARAQSVLGRDNSENSMPITAEITDSLVRALSDYLPHWDRRYPSGYVAEKPVTAYTGWSVVLCVEDYTLYRYQSANTRGNVPSDFDGFVDRLRSMVA